ncbi:TonB-dependent receptor [Sphingomonas sp. M1-B02]|uniref:TonB-dependent receptor n=1 Tax=Sphingomonas sp. M1-B02 TaxID=3114300 RepID=UPI00223F7A72|nr:TonB-dependent receptor [Sphingomonas sp. S6-11]UZK65452.1 TonB-dependent receptor [Sphingomonas sp. S6-11]
MAIPELRFFGGLLLAGAAAYCPGVSAQIVDAPAKNETAGDTAANPSEPPADDAQDIVVSGIRSSLEAALDVKRNSSQFVDAVVASDIGKLPDANIAESLQRVSGVQIRRSLGEGTSVSIRGLRQNRTEVNGRTLANPFGRGRGNSTVRDADYNALSLFPSELISRLEVIKLLSADQAEGSLGGTVNVITRKPLDGKGPTFAFDVSGVYADLSERKGYAASALVSKTFADDTIGVLVGVTYSERPVIDESFDSSSGFNFLTTAFNTSGNPSANDPNRDGLAGIYIADLRYQDLSENRSRLGANIALQFKPSEHLELYADAIYSNLDTDRRRTWLSLPLTTNASDYLDYSLSENEVLVAGTVRRPIQTNDERLTVKSDTISAGSGAIIRFGRFEVRPEISYNYARLENTQTFVRLQTISNYVSSFDFTGNEVPKLELPSNLDLLNPSLFRYSNVFDNAYDARTVEVAARTDATYKMDSGLIKSLNIGLRYADLEHRRVTSTSQPTISIPITTQSPSLYETVQFPGLLDNNAPSGVYTGFLAANPFATGEKFACSAIGVTCTPGETNPLNSFVIGEKTRAAYLKIEYEAGFLSGNIGVRYSHTARNAVGTQQIGATLSPVVAEPEYEDWLPSFILKADMTHNLVLRLGAAKVVGLPDFEDLSPGISLSAAPPFTGSAGNPNLEPFRANQVDAAIEWYHGKGAALTLGLFYKDIDSFVVQKSAFETPSGSTTQYSVRRSYNGEGGMARGVEILLQQPLTFLPAPLDGLGVLANFSFIDSSTSLINARTGEKLPLQGLSRVNYNLVGYFEKNGLSTRLAYNYRSRFFDSVATTGEGIFFDAYSGVDASIRYDFGSFAIYLEGTNLSDSYQRKYTGSSEATSLYGIQGRRFTLGVSGRF